LKSGCRQQPISTPAYNTVLQAQRARKNSPLGWFRPRERNCSTKPDFLDRGVNEGFSGGEKKRNEILQMALLEPRLAILDETDSGLDIDALRIVTNGVNKLANRDNGIILVTHYQRMLNYITPDFVHVMQSGRIIMTGGKDLALDLEKDGYDWVSAGKNAPAPVGA
jgi:Fe-S cluster assembly ATP-binding protein